MIGAAISDAAKETLAGFDLATHTSEIMKVFHETARQLRKALFSYFNSVFWNQIGPLAHALNASYQKRPVASINIVRKKSNRLDMPSTKITYPKNPDIILKNTA